MIFKEDHSNISDSGAWLSLFRLNMHPIFRCQGDKVKKRLQLLFECTALVLNFISQTVCRDVSSVSEFEWSSKIKNLKIVQEV